MQQYAKMLLPKTEYLSNYRILLTYIVVYPNNNQQYKVILPLQLKESYSKISKNYFMKQVLYTTVTYMDMKVPLITNLTYIKYYLLKKC